MTMTLPQEKARVACQEAIALARTGDKDAARKLLRQAVILDPANEVAWLYLVGLADNRQEAELALERVEQLNPANPHLAKARTWVKQTWPEPIVALGDDPEPIEPLAEVAKIAPTFKKSSLLTWQLASTVAVVLLIMLGSILSTANSVQETARGAASHLVNRIFPTPTNTLAQALNQLEQAVAKAETAGDQQGVIENLEKMYALAPYDQAITAQLAERYYEQGLALRNEGNFEAAQIAFNQALTIKETMENAQLEQQQVSLYLTGVAQHQQGNWTEAIAAFEEIYRQTPDYPFLDEILYSAYFNQGLASQANGSLEEALDDFERAAKILPNVAEARHKAEEVASLLDQSLSTSTSVITDTLISGGNKLVVVDISEQRTYIYQGNYLVDEFVVSTGAPGRDTAIGEFEIQNKIPVAYASTWNLDMPFWLGIYWSGPLQNGFHALPTVRHTGVTMWDGYLGQRVSYGCIILSQEDAKYLYNWVDVGTPVEIQW
jgi:tetratricopeptide (TPR) repeat protein